MKLVVVTVGGSLPGWVTESIQVYKKKISQLVRFEFVQLKGERIGRKENERKVRSDSQQLASFLTSQDFVVLCDERGDLLTSTEFSKRLQQYLESQSRRIVFVVGGPFGVDDTIRNRAQCLWSFSSLTLNHWIAQMVLMEQLYRGLTLWKGIPYHND